MYNQLPSTILREATSFDIMVLDVYAAWEHQKQNPTDMEQYNVDNLQELLKNVR